jgi:hypothetical protein
MANDLPTRRKLVVSHYVFDDYRLPVSQRPCARRPVFDPHPLEKSQERLLKSTLRPDLKIAGIPFHDLDIAETGLADVNSSLQEPIEY